MSRAHIISAAMIPMGKHRDSSYSGLAVPPVVRALKESGLSKSDINAVYCGHAFGGMLTGQRIVKEIGMGGIPVINVVAPGSVYTERVKASFSPEFVEMQRRRIPLREHVGPQDVAKALAFFLAPGSDAISGEVIRASGGLR